MVNLTGNERRVLKYLIYDSRISDSVVGKKLKISSQAVRKIRGKLRRIGVIKDYFADIDCSLLGIDTFAFVLFEISPLDEKNYNSLIDFFSQHLLGFYKILKSPFTHIGLFGFRGLNELDSYFYLLHKKYSDCVNVRNVYMIPSSSFLNNQFRNLLIHSLGDFGSGKFVDDLKVKSENKDNFRQVRKSNLSSNESLILRMLLKNTRVSYRKLAFDLKDVKLSGGGVSKIKERLEMLGVIRGYSLKVNYEKLGINNFAFIFLKENHSFLNSGDEMKKKVIESPNIISRYKLNKEFFQILFCGFRNLQELDSYCDNLRLMNEGMFDVDRLYVVSPKGIIVDEPKVLINRILDDMSRKVFVG